MFFATTTPVSFNRQAFPHASRSLERFIEETQRISRQGAGVISQDETSFTLSFDVPGVAKDQLSIGIEGPILRIESKEGAPRQYKKAYELPQDVDVGRSEAKLENGVLRVKLGKLLPQSRVTELTIA
jgi:HSP20 family protein